MGQPKDAAIISDAHASAGSMAPSHGNAPTDYILVQPTTFVFDMKDITGLDGVVWSDTYHGTRMNQKALLFHTQLHEWGQSQKISAQASKHVQQISKSGHKEVYLPVQKLTDIAYWTRDVNKYYLPHRAGTGKAGSFMKIDVSKYNMKVAKKPDAATRSKSAIYPPRTAAPGFRVFSAVSRGTMGDKRRFFGTDLKSVSNNLVESQLHYSAQRRNVYNPAKRLESAVKKADETCENDMNQSDESLSDSFSTIENTSSLSDPDDKSSSRHPIKKEIMQPNITSRSWSNRMLNVISIDDCKLTCRYRPQTIKETHTKPAESEKVAKQNKKGTKPKQHGKDEIDGVVKAEASRASNDADDEDGNSEGTQNITDKKKQSDTGDGGIDGNKQTQMNGHVNGVDAEAPIENLSDVDDNPDSHSAPGKDINKENEENNVTDDTKIIQNKIVFKDTHPDSRKSQDMKEERVHSGSNRTSKSSYGRITFLYQDSEPSDKKPKTKKKPDRRTKVKSAINNMVSDRRVMNTMDRDFDTRTAQFGRTTFDRTDGSETFQKIHSNLRKRIDTIMDSHSNSRTQQFYENRRKNSTTESIHSTA